MSREPDRRAVDPAEHQRRPHARPDLVFRRVGEDWLLFDPVSQEVHVLNLSAALVWSSCTGEMDLDGIVQDVGDAFDGVDVEAHVIEIVDRFDGAGLLVPRSGAEPQLGESGPVSS